MKFGIYVAPTDDPHLFASMAATIEDHGFDSVFLPEHTHVPVDVQEDRPGGSLLPHDVFKGGDPFIHLAAAAATTERILLGTGAVLLSQRDPLVLAKVVASLDRLSNGRVVLGFGAGWSRRELENHGIDPKKRWSVYEEKMLALRDLWTKDISEFHGDHVDFGTLNLSPKPVQIPHPPMWVSANGPTAANLAGTVADGWQPILLPDAAPYPLEERIAEIRGLAADTQRPRPSVTLFVFTHTPEPAHIETLESAGVDRCVYRVVGGPASDVAPILSEYSTVAASFT
jgi:probable F420-dependent oxidoreductase